MTLRQATAGRSLRRIIPDVEFGSPATTHPSGHIPVLDGVRGLAILLILIYHFTLGMSGRDIASRLLAKGTSAGWCGVDLFFVLSGFLITSILVDAKDRPRRFRNFYARRALRIFPLYYGTLAAVFALLPWLNAWVGGFAGVEEAGIWLALYGTNVLAALRGEWFPLSHFWSLAVEEHYYMFWPAVVFWCGRKTAMRICAAMVVLALAVRAWLVSQNLVLAAYCLTVCRIDALAVGSFLALAARGPGGVRGLVPLAGKISLTGTIALLALIGWRSGLSLTDPVVQTVGYVLLDLVFAGSLALVLGLPPSSLTAVFLNAPLLRWFGRYSYGLYVYNSIFILVAEGLSLLPRLVDWTGSPTAGRLLYFILAASCTLATSWLSWHLFEKQFLKLKRHFPSGSATRPVEVRRSNATGHGRRMDRTGMG